MRSIYIKSVLIVLLIHPFSSVNAHDPAKHKQAGEKPKCEAMAGMDHTKSDMSDPVMQAMMKKCKSSEHDKALQAGAEHSDSEAIKAEVEADHHPENSTADYDD